MKIDASPGSVSGIYTLPDQPKALLILAHGAGAGMQHAFMEELAHELSKQKIATLRFNFPYMEAGRKAPGSQKQAIEAIGKVVLRSMEDHEALPLFIGGKSYGGRMASHFMTHQKIDPVKGLIYYGFPLHPIGKAGIKRAEHLNEIKTPMLFLQGDRDKLADVDMIGEVVDNLPKAKLKVFEHADHSFKRPKKVARESLVPQLAEQTSDWINKL